jgi:hypothetical protein
LFERFERGEHLDQFEISEMIRLRLILVKEKAI